MFQKIVATISNVSWDKPLIINYSKKFKMNSLIFIIFLILTKCVSKIKDSIGFCY